MVARGDGHHLPRPRNAAGVQKACREPRVVTVELRLAGSVRHHLEQSLDINLAPIIVLPSGIDHAAVIQNLGIIHMHLVKTQPPEMPAILIAGVKIAHLGPPAIHSLDTPRRIENDVSVGKISPLVVGHTQSESELAHRPRRHLHLVQVIIILAVVFFPGKQDPAAIPRDSGVPNDAIGVRKQ